MAVFLNVHSQASMLDIAAIQVFSDVSLLVRKSQDISQHLVNVLGSNFPISTGGGGEHQIPSAPPPPRNSVNHVSLSND